MEEQVRQILELVRILREKSVGGGYKRNLGYS